MREGKIFLKCLDGTQAEICVDREWAQVGRRSQMDLQPGNEVEIKVGDMFALDSWDNPCKLWYSFEEACPGSMPAPPSRAESLASAASSPAASTITRPPPSLPSSSPLGMALAVEATAGSARGGTADSDDEVEFVGVVTPSKEPPKQEPVAGGCTRASEVVEVLDDSDEGEQPRPHPHAHAAGLGSAAAGGQQFQQQQQQQQAEAQPKGAGGLASQGNSDPDKENLWPAPAVAVAAAPSRPASHGHSNSQDAALLQGLKLKEGAMVRVRERRGPGQNREEGVGRVTAVHQEEGGAPSYDVKYLIGSVCLRRLPATELALHQDDDNHKARERKPSERKRLSSSSEEGGGEGEDEEGQGEGERAKKARLSFGGTMVKEEGVAVKEEGAAKHKGDPYVTCTFCGLSFRLKDKDKKDQGKWQAHMEGCQRVAAKREKLRAGAHGSKEMPSSVSNCLQAGVSMEDLSWVLSGMREWLLQQGSVPSLAAHQEVFRALSVAQNPHRVRALHSVLSLCQRRFPPHACPVAWRLVDPSTLSKLLERADASPGTETKPHVLRATSLALDYLARVFQVGE
jgi:hypothetical protein